MSASTTSGLLILFVRGSMFEIQCLPCASYVFVVESVAGVPIKLLHEGVGQTVVVQLKNGEEYRGTLLEAEDTMNCQLKDVILTGRDGRISKLEQVYLRGGQIKLFVLPEALKNSSIFKKVQQISKAKKDNDMASRARGAKRQKVK
jgi:small nuclear ribonucleoprotein D3